MISISQPTTSLITDGPPNHLLQSQVFRKIGKNSQIKIIPEKLSFVGFQPNESVTKILKVLNISSSRQRFHILPPVGDNFCIKYKKKDGPHVPGMSVIIEVTFKPNKWKTYTDAIRIHCPDGSDNLLIPLHAYPSVDTSAVPKRIDFNNVKLGTNVSKCFTIFSKSDQDIKFSANLKEGDSGSNCFKLQPSGELVLQSGYSQSFKLWYSPKEYCTKMTSMKLIIDSDTTINNSAIQINISGNCKIPDIPDVMEVAEHYLNREKGKKITKTPETTRKITKTNYNSANQRHSHPRQQGNVIHTQHGVNKLLLHGVKGSSNFKTHSFQPVEDYQYKDYKNEESKFLNKLNVNQKLERSCRVKWLERKGLTALSGKEREAINLKRSEMNARECYIKSYSKTPTYDNTNTTTYYQGRINRPANHIETVKETSYSNSKLTFSIYENNDWWKRIGARSKFKNAANIIMARNRANRVIKVVKFLAEQKIAKQALELEQKLEWERINAPVDPLQELLDRLIPIELSEHDDDNISTATTTVKNRVSELEINARIRELEMEEAITAMKELEDGDQDAILDKVLDQVGGK